MSNTTVAVNWFEIPAEDVGRAVEFYGAVLQTEMSEIPGPGGKPLKVFMGEQGPSGALMSGEGYTPGRRGHADLFGMRRHRCRAGPGGESRRQRVAGADVDR